MPLDNSDPLSRQAYGVLRSHCHANSLYRKRNPLPPCSRQILVPILCNELVFARIQHALLTPLSLNPLPSTTGRHRWRSSACQFCHYCYQAAVCCLCYVQVVSKTQVSWEIAQIMAETHPLLIQSPELFHPQSVDCSARRLSFIGVAQARQVRLSGERLPSGMGEPISWYPTLFSGGSRGLETTALDL